MEIKYPIIIFIGLFLFIITFIFSRKIDIKGKKINKNKVANTSFVRKTKEFQSLVNKYRRVLYFIYVLIFIGLISASVLSARIVKEQTISNEIYNRDIILCMDISTSIDDLNDELVENYKNIVKNLNGERFGISIFNTTSYLIVPLTTDYEYVLSILDVIQKALDVRTHKIAYDDISSSEYLYLINYIQKGTLQGNKERGSSIIGDGLASCVYDFPEEKDDRARIIILSTDNEVYGEEYIDVVSASKIAKKNNIKVYTIAPDTTKVEDAEKLKEVVNITGAKYYEHKGNQTVNEVVNEIETIEKTKLETNPQTFTTDYPTIPLILIFISFILIILVDKVVLS